MIGLGKRLAELNVDNFIDLQITVRERIITFPPLLENILHLRSIEFPVRLHETPLGKEVVGLANKRLGENAPLILNLREQMREQADVIVAYERQKIDLQTDYNRLNHELVRLNIEQERLNNQLNTALAANADQINNIKTEIEASFFMDGITLQILSGFATIIGTAAVALSLTVLILGSGGFIAPAVVMAVGVLLGTMGLYGLRKGAQIERDDYIERLLPNV